MKLSSNPSDIDSLLSIAEQVNSEVVDLKRRLTLFRLVVRAVMLIGLLNVPYAFYILSKGGDVSITVSVSISALVAGIVLSAALAPIRSELDFQARILQDLIMSLSPIIEATESEFGLIYAFAARIRLQRLSFNSQETASSGISGADQALMRKAASILEDVAPELMRDEIRLALENARVPLQALGASARFACTRLDSRLRALLAHEEQMSKNEIAAEVEVIIKGLMAIK